MTNINDYKLDQYCKGIAKEICDVTPEIDDAIDQGCEYADGSEYTIYHYKAHMLCQNCNTDQGEDFVADCWGDTPMTYDEMACRIAYGEIESRIRNEIYEIFENKEAA